MGLRIAVRGMQIFPDGIHLIVSKRDWIFNVKELQQVNSGWELAAEDESNIVLNSTKPRNTYFISISDKTGIEAFLNTSEPRLRSTLLSEPEGSLVIAPKSGSMKCEVTANAFDQFNKINCYKVTRS